ncbi:MAG TPA: type II toxin-antitoxin system VapB family antitoxin [Longimicrobiaceae bacterium]|nr:type II toxin-antitoxin system VapB family antitoxin [Longimicrobiaceae bacterium]
MALNIKNPEAERLARELARATGENITQAVTQALREQLIRKTGRKDKAGLREEIRQIQELQPAPGAGRSIPGRDHRLRRARPAGLTHGRRPSALVAVLLREPTADRLAW